MINQELVNSIHSLLDKGVTSGLSKKPKPGNMCVEQVISYALGDKINDEPSCVGYEVRIFVTRLNDRSWSSNSARAEGMRELAIAQLGSNSLDQKEFLDRFYFAVLTKMLPSMFRYFGEEKWEKEIKSLEGAKDLKEAMEASYAAVYAASFVNADDAVRYATLYTTKEDYATHYATQAAYSTQAAYIASYAANLTKTGDKYLCMVAHLAVEVLKEMKSPGYQFL